MTSLILAPWTRLHLHQRPLLSFTWSLLNSLGLHSQDHFLGRRGSPSATLGLPAGAPQGPLSSVDCIPANCAVNLIQGCCPSHAAALTREKLVLQLLNTVLCVFTTLWHIPEQFMRLHEPYFQTFHENIKLKQKFEIFGRWKCVYVSEI